MSGIRSRTAERLVRATQSSAYLTTFNEIDMSRVMDLRAYYKEAFKQKHGVSLGFMSFFIKASVEALKEFAEINAFIDGEKVRVLGINRVQEATSADDKKRNPALFAYLIQLSPSNKGFNRSHKICLVLQDKDTKDKGEGCLFWRSQDSE